MFDMAGKACHDRRWLTHMYYFYLGFFFALYACVFVLVCCKTLTFEAILVVDYVEGNCFSENIAKMLRCLFMTLRRTLPQVDSLPVNSLVRDEVLSLYNGYQITIEQ